MCYETCFCSTRLLCVINSGMHISECNDAWEQPGVVAFSQCACTCIGYKNKTNIKQYKTNFQSYFSRFCNGQSKGMEYICIFLHDTMTAAIQFSELISRRALTMHYITQGSHQTDTSSTQRIPLPTAHMDQWPRLKRGTHGIHAHKATQLISERKMHFTFILAKGTTTGKYVGPHKTAECSRMWVWNEQSIRVLGRQVRHPP